LVGRSGQLHEEKDGKQSREQESLYGLEYLSRGPTSCFTSDLKQPTEL
jgi:hypothetical protein